MHEGTNRSDVTPTVAYTTGQTIAFPEGVIEMTFRIMIHDDRDYEGDERFYLSLREPTGSSSTVTLGPQRITYVTIVDDDQALTGWSDTRSTETSTASQGDAASLPLKRTAPWGRGSTLGAIGGWSSSAMRAWNRRATASVGSGRPGPWASSSAPPDVRQRDGSNQRHLCGSWRLEKQGCMCCTLTWP